MLLFAAIEIILQHQVNVLRAREQEKKKLICSSFEDNLLTTPKTIHPTFTALSIKDQHVTNTLNLREQQRDHVTTQPEIRQKCISWIAGHCIVHTFKSEVKTHHVVTYINVNYPMNHHNMKQCCVMMTQMNAKNE